jgi:hypothetical protein
MTYPPPNAEITEGAQPLPPTITVNRAALKELLHHYDRMGFQSNELGVGWRNGLLVTLDEATVLAERERGLIELQDPVEAGPLLRNTLAARDGREGMVTVYDHEGRYLGCMGAHLWQALLDGAQGPDVRL